jgi:hypothetical protein
MILYGEVSMTHWVTISRAAELFGYTAEAIRNKISRNIWVLGVHYKKAPDGRIMINIEGVEKWIEQ